VYCSVVRVAPSIECATVHKLAACGCCLRLIWPKHSRLRHMGILSNLRGLSRYYKCVHSCLVLDSQSRVRQTLGLWQNRPNLNILRQTHTISQKRIVLQFFVADLIVCVRDVDRWIVPLHRRSIGRVKIVRRQAQCNSEVTDIYFDVYRCAISVYALAGRH